MQQMLSSQNNHDVRLVAADWMEEANFDPDLVEYIRVAKLIGMNPDTSYDEKLSQENNNLRNKMAAKLVNGGLYINFENGVMVHSKDGPDAFYRIDGDHVSRRNARNQWTPVKLEKLPEVVMKGVLTVLAHRMSEHTDGSKEATKMFYRANSDVFDQLNRIDNIIQNSVRDIPSAVIARLKKALANAIIYGANVSRENRENLHQGLAHFLYILNQGTVRIRGDNYWRDGTKEFITWLEGEMKKLAS